jgi:hypothetical protein
MTTFKIIATFVTILGLVLGFVERFTAPPLLALKPAPRYHDLLGWSGWILAAVGAVMLIFA